jgi:hypothetical protein
MTRGRVTIPVGAEAGVPAGAAAGAGSRRHRTLRALALMALLGALTACEKPILLSPSFWQGRGSRIAVAAVKPPDPGVHRTGANQEGLIAVIINESLAARMRDFLRGVGVREFETAGARFVEKLEHRGFQARRHATALDLEQLPEFRGGDGAFSRDLRTFGQTEGLDFLVLLSVEAWGTVRPYMPLGIPVGPPRALTRGRGRLVDLRTNQLMWQEVMADDESTVAVAGEWDQPPDYANLTQALRGAVEQAVQVLERHFFDAR